MTSHVKLEQARILGQIQKSYNNTDTLVTKTLTKEQFEKSLNEGDKFYEQEEISKYLENVKKSEDTETFEKAEAGILSLEKNVVVDEKSRKTVFVVRANKIEE